MTREEALNTFMEEEKASMEQIKSQFWTGIEEQAEKVACILKQVFYSIRQEVEKSEKKIMYFYFSLLRTDMMERNYNVMVQAMDARWYMDTEPVELMFSMNFLFDIINPFWDKMKEDSRKYLGKVNKYDIFSIIQKTVMECNGLVAAQLRFMLRDIEENKDFNKIPKEEIWNIRLGEYRDQSEIIACMDRVVKSQTEWNRAVRKTESKEEELVCAYWYGTDLKGSVCQEKAMYFIQFEACTLTNIDFSKSNLTGARFRNCTLKNCSFKDTILRQAEFCDCIWEEVDFQGADMTQTVFMEEEISSLTFSSDQMKVILVDRGQNKL